MSISCLSIWTSHFGRYVASKIYADLPNKIVCLSKRKGRKIVPGTLYRKHFLAFFRRRANFLSISAISKALCSPMDGFIYLVRWRTENMT